MCVKQANLEDVGGGLAYALDEVMGKFWSMVAQWRSSDAREWTGCIYEDDAVLMGHFSWTPKRLS
eukprot:CAMPEP_0201971542 /NCGR_PEP_ID=MMETSP0904-20121228/37495_1 /ASSEMBLY_ACC=CAM_ASM_000553 /TAXON_ID=420261 /ORGANISM="Thalassiosira antarctica, Strain CCMP982" /LENGTH=64 /DNA_ID=CAMNT_0048520995 /DNA_START=127 /DNA_END=321 /DNA_ORIENTATION=+